MALDEYRAIVIGSGQGGTPLSMALAKEGWRTALIERTHVGGTCINEGCTPTKTMVASARVASLARRSASYGVVTGGDLRVVMERIRQRKRDIVNRFRGGQETRIERTANLDLIVGDASFTGSKTLRVTVKGGGERLLTGETIIINAGARPAVPPLEGLTAVPFLDSTSIMELEQVPEHLLVLGGGYVSVEFAQMFRRFGSRVTIVQHGAQLLDREDADVAHEVMAILEQDGVEVLLGAKASRVAAVGSSIRLTVRVGNNDVIRAGSHLLVATGRTANSDSLNLPAAGVTTNSRGFIEVNDKLETKREGIFAIGDINGGPAFTHISYDDFRILRTNIIEKGNATTTGRLVPYTVFIDPQLGRVGPTEAEARAHNTRIRVARMPMTAVARAQEVDETRGLMKAIIDADTGHILGAAVLGLEGGEIMAMLQLAIVGKLRYTDLRDAVFAHPTLAESLNNLFAQERIT